LRRATPGVVALTAALSSAVAFVLYAALAARDVMLGDAPDLITAAVQSGVAHPPGFPVWVMLGHLASLVPVGPLAFRVNLTGCLYHALTVGLVFLSGFVLTRRIGAAVFAAVLLAIGSPLFVTWSLQAEVFSLSDLFAAAIVLLSLLWLDRPARWRLVFALAVVFGLGLTAHPTVIALSPLPFWAAWCGRAAVPRGKALYVASGCAVVLAILSFTLPYTYVLFVSQHPQPWSLGTARTLAELIDVIDRHAYGSFQLVPSAANRGGTPLERVFAMLASGGWPYLAIVLGVVSLRLRKRLRELVVLGLIAAVALVGFCLAANIDIADALTARIFERFGLLPLVALAPFSACAVHVWDRILGTWSVRTPATAAVLGIAGLVALLRVPALSLAGVHDARNLYDDIGRALPPGAILYTTGDAVNIPPKYFVEVEHWRPDVTIVTHGSLVSDTYRRALARDIRVPALAAMNVPPSVARDALVRANPSRPFFVTGDRPAHAPGPGYYPSVDGVVSQMIPNGTHIDVQRHFREEVMLQSRPGYAAISPDAEHSNGFGSKVREYYAGGFFSTAADAERVGDVKAARLWYERAAAYSTDPLIAAQLERRSR
jgi:hypothetical protein